MMRNQLANGAAINKLGRNIISPSALAYFVNGKNVRMIQGRSGPRLPLETAQARVVRNEIGRQDLQSNQAIEARVARQKYFAHAARTQPLNDRVRANIATNVVHRIIPDQQARIL